MGHAQQPPSSRYTGVLDQFRERVNCVHRPRIPAWLEVFVDTALYGLAARGAFAIVDTLSKPPSPLLIDLTGIDGLAELLVEGLIALLTLLFLLALPVICASFGYLAALTVPLDLLDRLEELAEGPPSNPLAPERTGAGLPEPPDSTSGRGEQAPS